ncbi:Uncharacterized protein SCF082_LOCUS1101 [Durusdinium trenchii]|uniref:Transmembrane protein 242 n=1 Tax=Durusdinium trenchii TaxID=1381693 RepID=A0ABP0HEI4_9DINO
MSGLLARLQALRTASQDFVKLSSQVIEDHKSLLWLVGTGSSALAGWCVYVLRRVHYERIEGAMSEISLKMKDIEKKAGDESARPISKIEMATFIVPGVVSAFSFGYLAGRTVSSYKLHKRLRLIHFQAPDRAEHQPCLRGRGPRAFVRGRDLGTRTGAGRLSRTSGDEVVVLFQRLVLLTWRREAAERE